jgi:hypothetical protein
LWRQRYKQNRKTHRYPRFYTSKRYLEITLETCGEDAKTTLETSGEDVKTTLETSGEDPNTPPFKKLIAQSPNIKKNNTATISTFDSSGKLLRKVSTTIFKFSFLLIMRNGLSARSIRNVRRLKENEMMDTTVYRLVLRCLIFQKFKRLQQTNTTSPDAVSSCPGVQIGLAVTTMKLQK